MNIESWNTDPELTNLYYEINSHQTDLSITNRRVILKQISRVIQSREIDDLLSLEGEDFEIASCLYGVGIEALSLMSHIYAAPSEPGELVVKGVLQAIEVLAEGDTWEARDIMLEAYKNFNADCAA